MAWAAGCLVDNSSGADMEKIDPSTLQRLLSGEQIDGWETSTAGNSAYSSPESGYTPAAQDKTPIGFSYLDKPNKVWRVYDIDGNLVRNEPESTGASTFKKFLTDGALIAGAGFGLNALGGALGGTGAAAGSGLGSLGSTGALSLADLGLAAIPEVGAGIGSLGSGALAGGGAGLGGALGSGGADAATSAAWATGSPGLGLDTLSTVGANGAGGLLSGFGNLPFGKIAGAALGALSSKDQQQTTTQTREPWGPAQDFIKQQIAQGQKLAGQYQQQPFSPQQQTAYNNYGGLLNSINSGAQGLLAGHQANASGANNYDRSDPRKKLIGSNFDLSTFVPGLLNFFPPKG